MYDEENDTSAPYDNVEFPVRKPGTGTWPGPGGAPGISGTGLKHHGYQTTGRSLGGPKLAPLVEVEGSEGGENNRLQTLNFGNTSLPFSSTQSSSVQQQQQNKLNLTPATQQINPLTPQNLAKGESTSSVSMSSNLSSSGVTSTTSTSSSITTATTTSTAQSGRQTTEKNIKPVIVVPNDSNTYIAAQVTSADTPKKKTLKQIDSDEEDFKRQDLNPGARLALERVYTRHPDFYKLNTKVLDEGSLLKQDVLDIYRKTGETLTYEQLLQGMLVDGERFLLGSCWLYYTHVQFFDVEGTKMLREPYGRGRIGLTNKRALFLSTETYTDANLEQFEQAISDSQKNPQNKIAYKLEVSKRNAVTFKNIPINNFHSAEMEVITGTAAQTKITKQPGCCGCLGMSKWVSTPPMTRSINSRLLRVGVSMPPWQTRMFLDIHLDPSMSLTVARDFITQLHTFAPHMH